MRWCAAVLALSGVALVTGCDRPEAEVRETLERVESAAVHGDRETLFLLHRDSVDGGPFCEDGFSKAWVAAGSASPEACLEARAVLSTPRISEEAALLALAVDFRCSHPEGTCEELARSAFLRGELPAVSAIEVNRIELRPDGVTAAAHVTLYRPDEARERAVVTLARVGSKWLLTSAAF